MQIWTRTKTGKARSKSGAVFPIEAIQDQIDDGRIVLQDAPIVDSSIAERTLLNLQTIQKIEALEKKALRNLLALSKTETKKERDYLNARISEIEALRATLET